jgi:hypothetical protein
MRWPSLALISVALALVAGCGPSNNGGGDVDAPSGDPDADTTDVDANVSTIDAPDVPIDAPDLPIDAPLPLDAEICGDLTCNNPVNDGCVAAEVCDNGADDNCNGEVDENCLCTAGAVQQCFRGPPGRRNVGACVDGMQTCQGTGEFREWGPCVGGIAPGTSEACDSLDNNCNGCVDDSPLCCVVELACPAPGSLPDGAPFENYVIDGTQFYGGAVATWQWDVTGGPCDRLFTTTTSPVVQTFTLTGANGPTLTLRPTLSGDYTVHVRITTPDGTVYECTFIVHIAGPGLRVEMCSNRTSSTDIDLHVHRPAPPRRGSRRCRRRHRELSAINNDDCYYRNCKATTFAASGAPTGAIPTARSPSAPAAPRARRGGARLLPQPAPRHRQHQRQRRAREHQRRRAAEQRHLPRDGALLQRHRRRAADGERVLRRPAPRQLRRGARHRAGLRSVRRLRRRRHVARRRRDADRRRWRDDRLHAHAAAPGGHDHRLLGHQHLDVLSHAAGGRAPGPQGRRAARLTAAASSPRSRGRGWR